MDSSQPIKLILYAFIRKYEEVWRPLILPTYGNPDLLWVFSESYKRYLADSKNSRAERLAKQKLEKAAGTCNAKVI